jgi:fumarate hydratase class II
MASPDMPQGPTRIERDSMGELEVPTEALYGASTQRAVKNFPISGQGLSRGMVRALGLVKLSCARVNRELGLLEKPIADAVEKAAREVADGHLDAHFVVDVFQTGSGTSSNMNANEVIANRAAQILGGKAGDRSVHPNDHVNRGQSSNDVFPTAIRIAALEAFEKEVIPALTHLQGELEQKAKAFHHIVKIARTHLQDAVPLRLGDELGGYASQIAHGIEHVRAALPHLRELPIGGTACGTGLNTPRSFGRRVAAELGSQISLETCEATNHFEAQGAQDAAVAASSALKTVAVSMMKIANDIRLLAMGPRCGLAELKIPAVQPGSSIMPGKVNPVLCEAVIQVGAQVQGCDLAVQLGGQWSQLDLNTMMPVIARNLLESAHLIARSARVFADGCVAGLEADEARCRELVEKSLALVTALNPVVGYDTAAEIAYEAHKGGKTLREVLQARGFDAAEMERLLDPSTMTDPDDDPPGA